MRKSVVVLLILVLCWIGYLVSPLYQLHSIVGAFEARDAGTIARAINFVRLRRSLTNQVMQAYVRRANLPLSPLAQSVVGSALSIADPIVDKLVSPEAVSALMTTGWPTAIVPEVPPGTMGISSRTLGTAWQIFASSQYGIGRYEVPVPPSFPRDQRFRMQFQIGNWRWQLVGIVLPEKVLDALADELIRITKTPVRSP